MTQINIIILLLLLKWFLHISKYNLDYKLISNNKEIVTYNTKILLPKVTDVFQDVIM